MNIPHNPFPGMDPFGRFNQQFERRNRMFTIFSAVIGTMAVLVFLLVFSIFGYSLWMGYKHRDAHERLYELCLSDAGANDIRCTPGIVVRPR